MIDVFDVQLRIHKAQERYAARLRALEHQARLAPAFPACIAEVADRANRLREVADADTLVGLLGADALATAAAAAATAAQPPAAAVAARPSAAAPAPPAAVPGATLAQRWLPFELHSPSIDQQLQQSTAMMQQGLAQMQSGQGSAGAAATLQASAMMLTAISWQRKHDQMAMAAMYAAFGGARSSRPRLQEACALASRASLCRWPS